MDRIILMADIVRSSGQGGKALMADFKKIVNAVNAQNNRAILSPLTITLGDEFQGVVKSARSGLQIILDIESQLIKLKSPFRLRYVLLEGDIQTSLNKKVAYEMLGAGLTSAREQLVTIKTSRTRFLVSLKNQQLTDTLNLLFVIFQGISDKWTRAQRKVVSVLLEVDDYRQAAERLKKDPTVIWRRKRSLMIEEFNSVRKLILKVA